MLRKNIVTLFTFMVAEQNVPTEASTLPATMVGVSDDVRRQPTLREELDEAEKEARVTKALQAVDEHGM